MQFEDEGAETETVGAVEKRFDLEEHLFLNGLSRRAISKMKDDIDSGDMNANILKDCTQNELNTIANDYNLTLLQTKAFIKAVKNIDNNNNNNNEKNNDESTQFVFVSPKDQQFLNDVNHFLTLLKNYQKKQFDTKNENKTGMNKILKSLKENGNKIKNTIDNIVNAIENNVCICILLFCCFVWPDEQI